MKKIFNVLLVFIICAIYPVAAFAEDIKIKIDGEEMVLDKPPQMVEGRVLVPLRSVFQQLGAVVDWNSSLQRVEVRKGSTVIVLPVNSKTAIVNGVSYQLDSAARLVQGSVLVPLRFLSQALDTAVTWDQPTQTVFINSRPGKSTRTVWGFYVDAQSYTSLQNNLQAINAVLPVSYGVKADGTIEEKVFFAQGYALAREQGYPVYPVLFQNEKEVLHQLLSSAEARLQLADSVEELLEFRNYQGVNLDFEGIADVDRDNYVELARSLRERLQARGYLLSITVPAKTHDQFSWLKGYDYSGLGENADYLVLMAYDQHYSGSMPGPVAALDWVEQVAAYAVQCVPAEKIILGLGLYGYDWPQDGKGKALSLAQAESLRGTGAARWDEKTSSPTFTYTDESGVIHQVWYENQDSVAGKLELIKKYGLSGCALWRLGIIPDHIWPVLAQ